MTKGSPVKLYAQKASKPVSAQPRTRHTAHQSTTHQTPAHEASRTGARESDSVAGHVSSKYAYWEESEILEYRPSQDTLLGLVRGVRLTEFIDRSSKGTYQGPAYNGVDLTPIVELPNHVPRNFDAWVDKEVAALVGKGCIVTRWSEVADVSAHPKPKVVLPVGTELTKPRLICDARYLNLMCDHSEFKVNGVGKVSQCSWQEAPNFFMSHKSVFHNVALRPDSGTDFDMYWKVVYYVRAVL